MIDLLPTKNGIYIQDGEKMYCFRRPWFTLSNYRNLRGRSLVIGYVGPRGSGKSVGATRLVILDFMLKGKKVWSNMEIAFNRRNNGHTVPMVSLPLDRLSMEELDKVYTDGIIYVDEVNLMMEARRSMSQENLMFSYILQQLRKRRLTIIWSAQSEQHCDDRLRFQTDIIISCADISITNPRCEIGALSKWMAYDFSGIVKGKSHRNTKDMLFYEGIESNKPFWNTYNTWEIQDVKPDQKENPLQSEAKVIANEIASYMKEEAPVLNKRDVWKRWEITDINMMMSVGKVLSLEHGIFAHNGKYKLDEELILEPA